MQEHVFHVRQIIRLAILCLTLASCGTSHDVPDYRYRLTVEVETPEGLRTGSSVIEVQQSLGRSAMNPAGQRISRRVRGEAVAVDLPSGQTFFALLRSENDIDWSARVMQLLAPKRTGEPWEEQFDNMLALEGERTVPRMWPATGHLGRRSAYPMLVTFGDLDDPTSVERVDPDDLAASFGEGVSLKRITVQMTDDSVATGIEGRLGWLSEFPEPSLKPDHALDDYSLAATLKHRAFRQGEY